LIPNPFEPDGARPKSSTLSMTSVR
jgi:hypothetical protein